MTKQIAIKSDQHATQTVFSALGTVSILAICLSCIFSGCEASVVPTYSTHSMLATGKCTPVNSLISSSNTSLSFIQTFTNGALSSRTYQSAFVSIISFDSYTSYEFSFNTTIKSLSVVQMEFGYRAIGNTYFTLLSFHYAAVFGDFYSVSNPSQMLIHGCFLCTNLTAVSGDSSMTFSKIVLNDTNSNDRYRLQSYISGMKFFNQYEEVKQVSAQAWIEQGSDTIKHQISKSGNSTLEWVCLNTVVLDSSMIGFQSYITDFLMGNFATVYYENSTLNYVISENRYDQANTQIFGISTLKLGADQGNQQLIFESGSFTDHNLNFQSVGVGAIISSTFVAQVACPSGSDFYEPAGQYCYSTCPDGTYGTASNICQPCSYTCLTCTTLPTTCMSCNETDHFRTFDGSPNTCDCNDGYLDVGVEVCNLCTNYIANCNKCDSTTSCTECSQNLIWNATQVACVCQGALPYFNLVTGSCWEYPGCISPGTGSDCLTCDSDQYFELNSSNQCQCIQDYYLDTATGLCEPVCGDGLVKQGNDLAVECDDGNTQSGDGCDGSCLVQEGYGCFSVLEEASICAVSRSVELEYRYTERVFGSNTAIIVFEVVSTDAQLQLTEDDFLYTIESTIKSDQSPTISYSPSQSLLKVTAKYTEGLEKTSHTLNVSYDKTKASIAEQSYSLTLTGVNYKLSFDDSPEMTSHLNMASMAISALIVLLFWVMVFFDQKLPATELLLSSQMVFFGLVSAGSNMGLGALKGLKYLNGYNDAQGFTVGLNNYQVGSILQEDIEKQFLLNFNFMAVVQLLSILLMLPFKMNIWKYERQKEALVNMTFDTELRENFFDGTLTVGQVRKQIHQARLLQKAYINRFYYPANLMCMNSVVFYFGVQNYASNINNNFFYSPVWSFILSVFCLLLCEGFVVYMFEESNKTRPIFTYLRKIIYYPFHMVFLYHVVVILYTMAFSVQDYSLYILAGSSVLILGYRLLNSPYPGFCSIPSLDSLFKAVSTLLGLLILIVIKSTEETVNQQALSIGVIVLLGLSWVSSLIRFVSVLCKRYGSGRYSKKDNQQFNSEVQSSKQEEEEKEERDSAEQSQHDSSSDSDTESNSSEPKPVAESSVEKKNESKLDPLETIKQRQSEMIHQVFEEEKDEDLDELSLIKKRLRADLRKKRGKVHKAAFDSGKLHKK